MVLTFSLAVAFVWSRTFSHETQPSFKQLVLERIGHGARQGAVNGVRQWGVNAERQWGQTRLFFGNALECSADA